MLISAIVAMSKNRVIGLDNKLPWHLSADLKRFRKLTMGHPIIMGRKTFESIGKPLPGRRNIVITRQTAYHPSGIEVSRSLEEAVRICQSGSDQEMKRDEIFIIGGAEIYKLAFSVLNRLYVTFIQKEFEGDAFFPEISPAKFQEVQREDHQGEGLEYSFVLFERTK